MSGLDGWTVAFLIISFLVAIVLHELMHGVTAYAFGDPTAKEAGRLTLNPVRHIDPFGTVVLPGILIALAAAGVGSGVIFGFAKPVPVAVNRLRRPRLHSLLVSLAGPATNLLLGIFALLAFSLVGPVASPRVIEFLSVWVLVNLILAVFNLLPVPPLDGSEIVAAALPGRLRTGWYRFVRAYSFPVLLVLVFFFPEVISVVIDPVLRGLVSLFG